MSNQQDDQLFFSCFERWTGCPAPSDLSACFRVTKAENWGRTVVTYFDVKAARGSRTTRYRQFDRNREGGRSSRLKSWQKIVMVL